MFPFFSRHHITHEGEPAPSEVSQPDPLHLSLPHSYNECTTEQLEGISRIFIDHAKAYTETGEYSETKLLTECFFLLSGLEVVGTLPYTADTTDEEVEAETYRPNPDYSGWSSEYQEVADVLRQRSYTYVCQFSDPDVRAERQTFDGEIRPIHVTTQEIYTLAVGAISQKDLDKYLREAADYEQAKSEGRTPVGADGRPKQPPLPPSPKGPLSWLMDRSTLTRFPYPELTLPLPERQREAHSAPEAAAPTPAAGSDAHPASPAAPTPTAGADAPPASPAASVPTTGAPAHPSTITLQGPAPLMSNFSWRQYRNASDYIQAMTRCENSLIQMRKRPDRYTSIRIKRMADTLAQLRREWLATIFTASIAHTDPETGQTVTDYYYSTSQAQQLAPYFADFPEEKLQCVMLWWQGMMAKLAKDYPKVFRTSKATSKPTDDDPLKLYSRSTATMIKYSGTTEEEVNRRTYTVVLQMINDMADENDQVKEMRSKHHKKK